MGNRGFFGFPSTGAVPSTLAASGGVETDDGVYHYHTFVASGILTVTQSKLSAVLVVAGGGGGGSSSDRTGGGGGAGALCARRSAA